MKRLIALTALAAALAACTPTDAPSPDLESPSLSSPSLESPSLESPSLSSPSLESPSGLESPSPSAS